MFGDHAAFRKNDEALAFVNGVHRFDDRLAPAAYASAIYGNVKLSIHEAKQRHFLHVILPYENCIDRIEAHRWNVEIRKVIGAEDVNFFRIELSPALHAVR